MRDERPVDLPDPNSPQFPHTRWSVVVRANAGSEAGAHEALADLCRDYWRPLFYFARRKGHSPEDAQDLTQGFIAELLERNAIARADHLIVADGFACERKQGTRRLDFIGTG